MIEEKLFQEINTIYKHLAEEEPSPDDEIKARDELIEKFNNLKNQALKADQNDLIEDILDKLKNWDPLDLWFSEVDGLSENIRKFINGLNIDEVNEIEQSTEPIDETTSEREKPDVNISEIVAQVSEQFKGEIDGLKSTIESLKKELILKDEESITTSKKTVIPQSSAPKSKLTAPKIRIPVINKAKKAPTIKIHSENEEIKESNEKNIFTLDVEADLRTEMENNLAAIRMGSLAQQRTTDELKQMLEPTDQAKSIPKPLETQKITPFVSEDMNQEADPEFPFELPQEDSFKELTNENGVILTPLPLDKPAIMKSKNDNALTPLPSDKPKILKNKLKAPEKIQEIPKLPEMLEKVEGIDETDGLDEINEIDETEEIEGISVVPTLTPVLNDEMKDIADNIEKVEEDQNISEITSSEQNPIFGGKSRITPISVEEIDTTSIDTSGADLFNMFSSVGTKTTDVVIKRSDPRKISQPEKTKTTIKSPPPTKLEISTQTKIKEKTRSMKIEDDPLPNDRNSLYQELIALEGRRYSLEKAYKDVSLQYGNGKVNDYEFNLQSESLMKNLDQITMRIKKIRNIISTMQNIQE